MRNLTLLFIFISTTLYAQVDGFRINKNQLKHYKQINSALSESKFVYVLKVSPFSDKKINKIENSPKKLCLYLKKTKEFENLYSITFDYLNIIKLPPLENCTYLEEITLSRMNKLDWNIFFKEIAKNKNIKRLIIRNCDNVEITDNIRLLKNLENLTISYTTTLKINNNISHLKKLKSIIFNHNEFVHFPPEIGAIKNLKRISIYDNPKLNFAEVINILSQCNELEHLNMYGNQLNTLPSNIDLLSNLKYLYVGNNMLTTLPMSLCNLQKLEKIIWISGQNTMRDLSPVFDKKIGLKKFPNGNYGLKSF